MMDEQIFNKFTKHLKNTLKTAGYLAKQENKKKVEPIHLLQGILHQQGSLAAEVLHKNGITIPPANIAPTNQPLNPRTITLELNEHARRIFTKMINIAFEYQHLYIGTEHLLMAILLMPDEEINRFLSKYKKDVKQIKYHLESILHSTSHFSDIANMFSDFLGDRQIMDRQPLPPRSTDKQSLLEMFTTDLTSPLIQKNIDPVIGRGKEIERLVQILSRRHKNNPLLIGEPGVGKTAIVEGLAKKIMTGDVPEVLKDKKILSLDLGLLVAGTMYRGEFEARLKSILDEIKANPNIIIFIDEIHNIIGAGSTTGGTMDAANLIKPALARGEIRCIGATTHAEFRKYIETDAALERRFQTIYVDEASATETKSILLGLKKYYEDFHQVKITDEAIESAIALSVKFIPEKFLPDKAIDIIDEAASRVKIKQQPLPWQKLINQYNQELQRIEQQKDEAILAEDYDAALDLKDRAVKLKNEIKRISAKHKKKASPALVSSKNVVEVVSQMTNIPESYLTAQGSSLVKQLNRRLKQKIIGQNEAIDELVNIIKRAQLGMAEHTKPIGSFLFLGPSGVGKTELARLLAREYFGREDALIKIDMSEYAESFNISKLIGAPAGYVGYKEGGKLTQSVRRRPYSVVLFDEIEKGHPEVANLLLQILDEGYLTDAEGRKVDFKNTIVIITSNIASDKFSEQIDLGFATSKQKQKTSFDKIKQQVLAELEENFKPELINRLDKIIVFNALGETELKKITKLNLAELANRLKQNNIELTYSTKIIPYLTKLSYNPLKGAREIKRVIQNNIEQPIVEMLLQNPDKRKFHLDYNGKQIVITAKK